MPGLHSGDGQSSLTVIFTGHCAGEVQDSIQSSRLDLDKLHFELLVENFGDSLQNLEGISGVIQ